jgi:hypothetical protein
MARSSWLPFADGRVPGEHDRRLLVQQVLRLHRWRLGTIAVYEDNIFDKMIAAHPEPIKKLLDKRYGGLTLEPRKFASSTASLPTAATSRSITRPGCRFRSRS